MALNASMNSEIGSASTEEELQYVRRWSRYPGQVSCASIVLPGQSPIAVRVEDESFGGIGVLVEDNAKLNAGDELQVACDRFTMRGLVRRIEPRDNGQRFVGIEWLDRGAGAVKPDISGKRRFVARFVEHSGVLMVCNLAGPPRVGVTSVALPGGATLRLDSKLVFARTLGERREELRKSSATLWTLASHYGLQVSEDDGAESTVEQILDFEYRSFYADAAKP